MSPGKINTVSTIAALLLFPGAVFGQMAVFDATASAQRTQQQTDILQQWTQNFQKLDTQIQKLDQNLQTVQTIMNRAGDPTAALQSIGGAGLVGSENSMSGVFKLTDSISSTLNSADSLNSTGNGIYKAVPSSLPDGTQITRNLDSYKPYAAFESDKDNHEKVLSDIRSKRQKIMSEVDRLKSLSPQSEVEQRQIQAQLQASQAQLAALNAEEVSANNQRQARHEANVEDREKQRLAEDEENKAMLTKGAEAQASSMRNIRGKK